MQASSATTKKKISLEDFQVKRIIGKGSYGDVFLVTKDNQPFAMKQIIKRKLHRQKKQYQAMVERQLLRYMKHPGIIKLRYAFQDKSKLYFVMEYCQLGEFVRFMKEYVEHFTEEVRRFYIAEIINILEYLHENGITHRDLKPQNLLLSKDGHLKLVDFGTSEISQCKILSNEFKEQIQKQKDKEETFEEDTPIQQPQQQPQEMMSPRKRRSTFVGTSYYISPQLLQHNVCEPPSDLWALGCILYQLYYLQTPFKDSTQYGVFEKIKKVQLQFPKNDIICPQGIDLIKKLLIKNPEQRLGSCSRQQLDFKHLKAHPYFKGIDIDKIYSTIPPDINVKKFSLFNEQMLKEQKLKEFKQLALKILAQQQKKAKESNSPKSFDTLIQGTLQKREFPYYQHCYLRIYKDLTAKMIKLQRYQQVQDLQFYHYKGQQPYEIAKLLEPSNGKFWIEMKDRARDIYRGQDGEKWVSVVNQSKQVNHDEKING